MIGSLRRDESGAALGLAVILVAVIGVMAAGLLTALQSDLGGAIQASRGQSAFFMADAGAQAAAAHLRSDANPDHYDEGGADNSDWARIAPRGPPGKTLAMGEASATVSIGYLMPARTPAQLSDERHAPELVPDGLPDYPNGDFFLVVSEGESGATRRRVEVILSAESSGGVVLWSWREDYG